MPFDFLRLQSIINRIKSNSLTPEDLDYLDEIAEFINSL